MKNDLILRPHFIILVDSHLLEINKFDDWDNSELYNSVIKHKTGYQKSNN